MTGGQWWVSLVGRTETLGSQGPHASCITRTWLSSVVEPGLHVMFLLYTASWIAGADLLTLLSQSTDILQSLCLGPVDSLSASISLGGPLEQPCCPGHSWESQHLQRSLNQQVFVLKPPHQVVFCCCDSYGISKNLFSFPTPSQKNTKITWKNINLPPQLWIPSFTTTIVVYILFPSWSLCGWVQCPLKVITYSLHTTQPTWFLEVKDRGELMHAQGSLYLGCRTSRLAVLYQCHQHRSF